MYASLDASNPNNLNYTSGLNDKDGRNKVYHSRNQSQFLQSSKSTTAQGQKIQMGLRGSQLTFAGGSEIPLTHNTLGAGTTSAVSGGLPGL